MLVSEECVVLHKSFVHMRQSGALNDEVNEKEEQFGIISQFIVDDTTRLEERRVEHLDDVDAVGCSAESYREPRQSV